MKPNDVAAINLMAVDLMRRGRFAEAEPYLRQALAMQWNDATLHNYGLTLRELGRIPEALQRFTEALALNPAVVGTLVARGDCYFDCKQYRSALADYDGALRLQPRLRDIAGQRLAAHLSLADWDNQSAEIAALDIGRCHPLLMCAISISPAELLRCACSYVGARPRFAPIWSGERYRHDRIRVAYLSSDLNGHAVASLAVGLFEHHDRARFEITAVSFGRDDKSAMRRRLMDAFEHFIDVRGQSDEDIAQLIRRNEIDIAVDLNGHTDNSRTGILARRPAPIQVNYLGYPGTMGAPFIDYVIADATVIPEEHRQFYTEQVIWLPHCYQVNDDRRRIAETMPTRRDHGLPNSAVVFCCFNNVHKIMPQMFDIWMRLLRAVDGSVLWLLATNPDAVANLKLEAQARGVLPDRLVFAPVLPHSDHLARLQLADLVLDTLPYNAHTTASDALWVHVPVVTCLGTTFAGRVGASLLQGVGMAELITPSLDHYATLALALARDPQRLATIRQRLAAQRETAPLFDTAGTARAIETVYMTMWQRYQDSA